jgi:transcriptional regulator with XRE-family HTH domain
MNVKKKKAEIFSKNLKNLRKERGLSQYDLADRTGISSRMIGHYERHATEPPIEKIELIAKALNVSVTDLLEDKENNEDEKIDVSKFDTRSLKKLQDILSLPPNDRADLYRMLNKMLRKNQLEKEKKILQQEKSS